jgi:KRAB domain-containing zinc finger protein
VRLTYLSGNNHRRTHTGEKPFKCERCDRRFAASGQVTVHMRTHTGEKPYKCEFCDKKFAGAMTLRDHVRLHTGERPFGCPHCEKRFTQRPHLTRFVSRLSGFENRFHPLVSCFI